MEVPRTIQVARGEVAAMSSRDLAVDPDFAALTAAAQSIDPGRAPAELPVPLGTQTLSFTLDHDLIKLVTLTRRSGHLAIRVRYATDTVIDEDSHAIPLSDDPQMVADGMGVVITWRARLIPGVNWLVTKRTRRF